MVENGYFDDTKPDPMPSAVGGLDAPRAAGTPTAAQAQAQPAAVNKPRSTMPVLSGPFRAHNWLILSSARSYDLDLA